jgi:hypothetical protein
VLPGLGQLYAGRAAKGALVFATILAAFAVGWHLTDLTGVDPARHRLHFVAQAFAGGPSAAALWLGQGRALEAMPRWFDVGMLYTTVAGLLNLVAMCDAMGEVIGANRRAVASARAEHRGAVREAVAEARPDTAPPWEEPSPSDVEPDAPEPA